MKRTKINILIVAMLILCTALSVGCLEEEAQTYVQNPVIEKPTVNKTEPIPEPKITIKSVNVDRSNIIIKILNEGESSVDNLMVGFVDVRMVASKNHHFYWSDFEEFDNAFYSNIDDIYMLLYGTLEYGKASYEDDDFSERINLPYCAHIEAEVYQDYVGTLKPNEIYESTSIQSIWDEDTYSYGISDITVTYLKVVWSDNDGKIVIHDIW